MKRTFLLGIVAGAFAWIPAAQASTTFATFTGIGTVGGVAVDAEADFTILNGVTGDTVTVTLINHEADPTSVAQNITGFSFRLSDSVGFISATGITESNNNVNNITVASGGSFTTASNVADTGWTLTPSATTFSITALGPSQPKQTIIGPPGGGGTYDAAGGSIAGNGPHNPFINQSATFVFTIPSLTTDTHTPFTVSNVVFSFNTSAGSELDGSPGVPEPMTLGLTGAGLAALYFLRRRRQA